MFMFVTVPPVSMCSQDMVQKYVELAYQFMPVVLRRGTLGVPNIAILQEKLANTENLCRKSMKSPTPHSDPLIKLHPSTCSVFIYLYLYSLLIELYSLL